MVLVVGPCYTDLWSYEGWILILRGWGTGGGGMSLDNRQPGHNDHLGDTRTDGPDPATLSSSLLGADQCYAISN